MISSTVTLIFALLVAFQLKHFLADFPLQTPYMLGKFSSGWDWVAPLAAHAGLHAILTFNIVMLVNPSLWWLALVDFAIHATMDRVKASPNMLGRYKITEKYFWWSLGLDQSVHHLTHYGIIFCLVVL